MNTKPTFIYFWGALALTLLFLILATLADAASPPPLPSVPVVKRPKPLLSPAHANQPKAAKMVKTSTVGVSVVPGSELPLLPMTMEVAIVSNLYGRFLFTASALKPANHALIFEMSAILGDWVEVGYFGPGPDAETSFVSLYGNAETMYVRGRIIPIPPVSGQTQTGWMPASLTPVVGVAGRVYVNPNLPGARAWSVRK